MTKRASKTIGELLPHVLKETSEKHQTLQRFERQWRQLVGREIAQHTKLVSFRRGTLYVQTDHPGASFTVQLDKPRLLQRLNGAGTQKVDDIVIRPGDA